MKELKLLNEIKKYITEALFEVENDEKYNLLKVMKIETEEVLFTRVLADLLNPLGRHHLGNAFLKSFLSFDKSLQGQLKDNELNEVSVILEKYIPENGRRPDIWLEHSSFVRPIEVKINNNDSKSQCYDYLNYSKKFNKKFPSKIFYISRYGEYPSVESLMDQNGIEFVDNNEIIPVSLFDCIVKNTLSLRGDDMVQFSLDIVRNTVSSLYRDYDFCMIEKVENILKTDNSLIKSAIYISEALHNLEANVINRLFSHIEKLMFEHIGDYGLIPGKAFTKYSSSVIRNYISCKDMRALPGLSYRFKDNIIFPDIDGELIFRIEMNKSLFAGFLFKLNGKGDNIPYNKISGLHRKEFEKISHVKHTIDESDATSDVWIASMYIPAGMNSLSCDNQFIFGEHWNDNALSLMNYDESMLKKLAEQCVDVIFDELLFNFKSGK